MGVNEVVGGVMVVAAMWSCELYGTTCYIGVHFLPSRYSS